jgi:hypothetical protein|tara:strand:+ start:3827 stop:5152 length:1326 start_codon:yes stop_codon:yes gene_type:complete
MAHILNSSKYGEGHKVVLKPKLSNKLAVEMRKNGYKLGSSIFTITKKKVKPTISIELSANKTFELFIDHKKRIVQIFGNDMAFHNTFNHHGKGAGGKSETKVRTETKEIISLCVIREALEKGKKYDDDKAYDCLPKNLKQYYEDIYLSSAMAQLKAFRGFIGSFLKKSSLSGYLYERQQENLTRSLYKKAAELSGLQADNWNPADIWLIRKGFNMKRLLDSSSIGQLNIRLREALKNADLIGVSLKQVEAGKVGKVEIINNGKKQDVDKDFTFDTMQITDTFANATFFTKSLFGVRISYKSGVSLSVSLEGKNRNEAKFLGGIDAKAYPKYVADNYGYKLRNGSDVNLATDEKLAMKEMKEIFVKYPASKLSASNNIKNYGDVQSLYKRMDIYNKKRFCNITSYIYSYLIIPKNKFSDHMEWSFLTAKKISKEGGVYVLLK